MNEGARQSPPSSLGGAKPVQVAALAAVLATLALVELDVARSLSITYDERAHIGAGFSYLRHGEVVLNLEHPPLVKLLSGASLALAGAGEGSAAEHYERARVSPEAALFEQWPYATRLIFHDNQALTMPLALAGADSVVFAARAPLIVFPVVLCLFAFLWARALFGTSGGFIALGIAATYPDLLGHGALVATDVPVAAFAVAAGYSLDAVVRRGGTANLILLGLAVGGALASKFSGPILAASFAAAAALAAFRPCDPVPASFSHPFGHGPLTFRASRLVFGAAVVAGLALLVVVSTYLGDEPFSSYRRGLTNVAANHSPDARALCLGNYAPWFWYYFPVVTVLKLPLGTLGLLILAAVAAGRVRRGVAAEIVLHLPALLLLVATSAFAPQIGSRYLVPVVSFLTVSAGRLGPWAGVSLARWAVIGLGLAASFAHVVREHPFHGSSTNELAGEPRLLYRVIDDSNQDWGQGLEALAAWQRGHAVRPLEVVARFPMTDDAELAAYGVDGRVVARQEPVLFVPRQGVVYAVSPHLVAWGRRVEIEQADKPRRPGMLPPRLALGGLLEPDEIVGGGYLIFDLRERRGKESDDPPDGRGS
jgi:hypothetical protein